MHTITVTVIFYNRPSLYKIEDNINNQKYVMHAVVNNNERQFYMYDATSA